MNRTPPRLLAAALALAWTLGPQPSWAGVGAKSPPSASAASTQPAPEDGDEGFEDEDLEASEGESADGEAEADEAPAALPACPFPSPRPKAPAPVLTHLTQALAAPRAAAGELAEALRSGEARSVISARYCARPSPLEAVEDGCASAMVQLSPDGSIRYRSPRSVEQARPGRFCLTGGREAWGPSVVLRAETRGGGEVACFQAVPGSTYELAAGSEPAALVRVWGERKGSALESARKQAEASASAVVAAAYKARVFRLWAARVAEALPQGELGEELVAGLTGEVKEELARLKGPALAAATRGAGEALSEIASDAEELFADPPEGAAGLAKVCNYASIAPYADSSAPLAAELRARDAEPAKGAALLALRDLASASHPAGTVTLPWAVFEGELPTTAAGVPFALHAERGSEEAVPQPFDEDRVTSFVHDLGRGQGEQAHTVAFIQGNYVAARPSDIALVTSAVLSVARGLVQAGAVGALGGLGPIKVRGARGEGDEALLARCRAALCAEEKVDGCEAKLEKAIPADKAPWQRACRAISTELPQPEPDHVVLAAALGDLMALESSARWTESPGPWADAILATRLTQSVTSILAEPVLPANAPPSAKLTSRVLVSPKLAGGHPYELRVCRGSGACGPKTPPQQVAASVGFSARERHRLFSTITELAWNGGTVAQPLGGYALAPVGSAGVTGDQLYVLHGREGFGDRVSLAQLFALYPFGSWRQQWLQGLGLAVGTTFATGAGFDLFHQWNFRVIYEPAAAPGVVLTAGPSVRLVDEPVDPVGTVYAGKPDTVPGIEVGRTVPAWLLSLGVSVDLAVVGGEVVSGLGGLFGGSEEPVRTTAAASARMSPARAQASEEEVAEADESEGEEEEEE